MSWVVNKNILNIPMIIDGIEFNDLKFAYCDTGGNKPVMLVTHGFSSDSNLPSWWTKFSWDQLIEKYRVISINTIGSCHGSSGPRDYFEDAIRKDKMLNLSIEDSSRFFHLTLSKLGVKQIDTVLGCSLGGMQALDFSLSFSDYSVKKCVSVCAAPLSNFIKIYNKLQIDMILKSENCDSETMFLMAKYARAFFRLSCTNNKALDVLDSKLKYPGDKFTRLYSYYDDDGDKYPLTFDRLSYVSVLNMIHSFKVKNEKLITKTKFIMVGIESDQFTPASDVYKLTNNLKSMDADAIYLNFNSDLGHEAWILDGDKLYEMFKNNNII